MAKKKIDKDESENIVASALEAIRKSRGSESISTLDSSDKTDVRRTSSGILSLDKAIGGGFPVGRIIECLGMEASGKTSVALHYIAASQKNGMVMAYVDAEHAFDRNYAIKLGVDPKKLIFTQPDSGEDGLNIVEDLLKLGNIDGIIIDSVDALIPQAEMDGEVGEVKMGLKPRMMSQAMRKFKSRASNDDTTLFFINQMRESMSGYGGKNGSGGNALKFYSSIRLDVRKIGAIKTGDDITGQISKVKVIKNKTFPPFREVELEMIHGFGFDPCLDIMNVAVDNDIIKKAGSWYSYQDTKLGQGKDKALSLIKSNPKLLNEIAKQVKTILL